MSGQFPKGTPPKTGRFNPRVYSTPSASSVLLGREAKKEMTAEEAEAICSKLAKEYKEFLASATERFNQLTVQQKAQAESLKKTRAEEATLTASIEAEDEEIRKKQEELKQKDKEIAAKRDALMGEMKNVSALKETMGVEKIELERTLVNDVVSKLKEVLSLLGDGTPQEKETQKTQKNIPVTIELGKEVLGIMELIYKEHRGLVKMFGNPSEKLFGWVGDVYYPCPRRSFLDNKCGFPDKDLDRNKVPGRPTHVAIMPLTTNGSCISIREYKAVQEVGLEAMTEFARSTKQRSRDGVDMEANIALSSPGNTKFQRLVDAVIRAFIPPKLRGFFTNPQSKEEYVKVTRDGITALLAGVFNKATKDMSLDSNTLTTMKTAYTKQVFAAIVSRCNTQKLRDLCNEALARVNNEIGIVLRVKGTRKLMTMAASKAKRGIVDEQRLLDALNEAYKKEGTEVEEDEGSVIQRDERQLRKRKPTQPRTEAGPKKKGRGITRRGESSRGGGTGGRGGWTGGRGGGTGGRGGGTGGRGKRGRKAKNGKGRNPGIGDEEEEEETGEEVEEEEAEGKKKEQKKSLVTKGKAKASKTTAMQKKTQKYEKRKDFEETEEGGSGLGNNSRFVDIFDEDEEDDEDDSDDEEEGEYEEGSEDETKVDEIIHLQAKPKSARQKTKGKTVAPNKVIPWEGNKIRGDYINKRNN